MSITASGPPPAATGASHLQPQRKARLQAHALGRQPALPRLIIEEHARGEAGARRSAPAAGTGCRLGVIGPTTSGSTPSTRTLVRLAVDQRRVCKSITGLAMRDVRVAGDARVDRFVQRALGGAQFQVRLAAGGTRGAGELGSAPRR
jgi:hypothetical protein